jgi:hypothetical protein
MNRLSQYWRRLLFYLHSGQFDRELEEEMRFHLEMKIQENLKAGMEPEQARRAARRQFGNTTLLREVSREMWGFRSLEVLLQDLRFAIRLLLKTPGFTAVAVVTLALGIGANTAIFSVVNTVLLKPLPYKNSEQLMLVWEEASKYGFPHNTPAPANFIDWRDRNQVFEDMAAFADQSFNLTGIGEPERIQGQRVSSSLFPLLGAEPILGRVFLPEEDRPEGNRVVVLSHGLWQRRFGSDKDIIGKTLTLNADIFTVVGIMPPSFQFPDSEDELWQPWVSLPACSCAPERWCNTEASPGGDGYYCRRSSAAVPTVKHQRRCSRCSAPGRTCR